jgi:hypothetical protein
VELTDVWLAFLKGTGGPAAASISPYISAATSIGL